MTNLPPRLSDEDIDEIVLTHPVWHNHPNREGGIHFPLSLFQIKPIISQHYIDWFKAEGYSDSSWEWSFIEHLDDDVPLDEFGPFSFS